MRLGLQMPYTDRHLRLVERLGLSAVQLRVGPGFPIDTNDDCLDEIRGVAEDLRERSLAVSAIGFYRNMLTPDFAERAADLQRLRRVMRMSSILGTDLIGVFAGRDPERTIEENIPAFKSVWTPLVREAEDLGLRFAFENCTMFRGYPVRGINLCHTPHAYELMFEAIDSPAIGIEYDPSHLLKQLIDPVGFLRRFPGRILHVHAKDHERIEGALQDHGCYSTEVSRDRFPGNGQIDFRGIFTALRESNYDGDVTIEGERDPLFTTEEEIAGGLACAVTYLKALMT